MGDPETVDEYLATLPPDRRAMMDQMRATIMAAAPEAVESLAYKMPAFRSHGGQFLVSYDAYKHHYSLFPASEHVVEGLENAPGALMGLLKGENFGKVVVRVGAEHPASPGLPQHMEDRE